MAPRPAHAWTAASAEERLSGWRNRRGHEQTCVGARVRPRACRSHRFRAVADVTEAAALNAGLIEPADAALRRALLDEQPALAQANSVGTAQRPLRKPAPPQGFSYTIDVSAAYREGNLGDNAKHPGGMDAGFGYAFSRTNRLAHVSVPLSLRGYTGPGTTLLGASLGNANTGPVGVTAKDRRFTAVDQNPIAIGGRLPIVISPTPVVSKLRRIAK
jgi:hypothetical protein